MFSKYEYVYAVYKERNFTRAAQKLFISQPSLSAAIKNIEKRVGAPLFERTGSRVKLTEVGREYIDATEKMINIKNDFENKINDIYNLQTGQISVGGSNYLSSYVLPRIITRFSALYPQIKVTLTEANSKNLSEMIKSEQLDLFIDSFDEPIEEYQGFPLVSERILLCVPANRDINAKLKKFQIYPDNIYNGETDLNSVPHVPIEIFKDENFILLKNGNDMYKRAMNIFDKGNINPNVSFSVDQLNISYALVEAGMGLCFATDTFFRYGRFRNNVILYSVGNIHSRTLYIAYKRNKYCTKAMDAFINVAKEVIR